MHGLTVRSAQHFHQSLSESSAAPWHIQSYHRQEERDTILVLIFKKIPENIKNSNKSGVLLSAAYEMPGTWVHEGCNMCTSRFKRKICSFDKFTISLFGNEYHQTSHKDSKSKIQVFINRLKPTKWKRFPQFTWLKEKRWGQQTA